MVHNRHRSLPFTLPHKACKCSTILHPVANCGPRSLTAINSKKLGTWWYYCAYPRDYRICHVENMSIRVIAPHAGVATRAVTLSITKPHSCVDVRSQTRDVIHTQFYRNRGSQIENNDCNRHSGKLGLFRRFYRLVKKRSSDCCVRYSLQVGWHMKIVLRNNLFKL